MQFGEAAGWKFMANLILKDKNDDFKSKLYYQYEISPHFIT